MWGQGQAAPLFALYWYCYWKRFIYSNRAVNVFTVGPVKIIMAVSNSIRLYIYIVNLCDWHIICI